MIRTRSLRAIGAVAACGVIASLAPAALSATATAATDDKAFHRTATYPVYQNAPAKVSPFEETVAEISSVSEDGRTLVYTDAAGKRIGFLDITDPAKPRGAGTYSLATAGSPEDEPTSVAVAGRFVLVVVNTSESYTKPSGRLDIIRLTDNKLIRKIDLGGQPDSIAISPDGKTAAIAIENERDEDFTPASGAEGDLPQLPAGFVQLIDMPTSKPSEWTSKKVALTNSDGSTLAELNGLDTPTDPEPEYVAFNSKGTLAVSLQENNGIVIIDPKTAKVTKAFSTGTVDLDGIDATKDNQISLTDTKKNIPREPDAIAWIGDDHIATANEGDWKGGSRGWSVFTADGNVAWDAGNSFEHLAVKHGLYIDSRADKKGPEPEGLAVATFDGTTYAFVGSERSNFVAVYDVSKPDAPKFSHILPTTNGPEGLLPIPSRGLFAVSSETDKAKDGVRATVGLYSFAKGKPAFPSIVSDDVDGKPIGWQALGALSGDPKDPKTVWTASDNVLKNGTLFKVDVSQTPARITSQIPVTEAGAKAELDVEGLFARPQGGFWLASEGATGPKNELVRTDDKGVIQERVTLPADVSDKIGKWGLEGVTATTDAAGEHVWFVIQRPLWDDIAKLEDDEGDDIVRIGRYDVSTKTFHWYGYQLSAPKRGAGDWVGLSEITALSNNTFAVIERDKLNGPDARNKRIYTVTVPSKDGKLVDPGSDLTVLDKRRAIDVLPHLKATNGWTQEKLEGFTVAADGQLYAVTDNDGLKDATGETVFLRLGKATKAFGSELATKTSLSLSAKSAAYAGKVTAAVKVTGASSGRVGILNGTKVIARATVSNGTAKVTLPSLLPGAHKLTARLVDGPLAASSVSGPASLRVVKANASVAAKAKKQVKRGKQIAIRATVKAAGHKPSGKAVIKVGTKTVKTVTVKNGKVATKYRFATKGTKKVRVIFTGKTVKKAVSKPITIRVR